MKKLLTFALLLFVSALLAAEKRPKYICLFIGDGMSVPQRMIADEYASHTDHGPLTINNLKYQAMTTTKCADKLVTDSAASATAIACGEKTNYCYLGVDPTGERKLVSCAEVAHQKGKKVGIVTSVIINHATPGGFYAHRKNRSMYYGIGLDLIASGFEYFAGGGFGGHHDKKDDKDYKGNIYDLAAQAGYTVCRDKESFEGLKAGEGKVLAVGFNGSEGNLPFAIDGQEKYPTLEEMTSKGIELLDNPNGFFMMVEGGEIDHCGHANDAAANMNEVLAFDNAVRVAVAFSEKHPDETLIIVTGDHETGGMTMGFAGGGYAFSIELLTAQKCSAAKFNTYYAEARKAKADFNFEDAKILLNKYFSFKFEGDAKQDRLVVRPNELKTLEEAFNKDQAAKSPTTANLTAAARVLLSTKSGIGWSTNQHTALPTLTTSQGACAEIFTGLRDNTDISKKIKSLL